MLYWTKGEEMETKIFDLKGGAKLLFTQVDAVDGVSINYSFQAGALNDPIDKLGVAHFCEHALCSFPTAKETREERGSHARKFNYRNAYTSLNNISFVMDVVEEDFDEAIDFITEPFASLKITKEEFDKEYNVINDEIKTRIKLNDHQTYIIDRTEIVKDEYYNRIVASAAGTTESLSRITMEDLKNFISSYLTLNNLVISISGKIDEEKVAAVVKKYIDKIPVSSLYGYDEHNQEINSPCLHYAYPDEKDKALFKASYFMEKVPFSHEKPKKIYIAKIVSNIINEQAFQFFREENELCYSCQAYCYIYFDHLECEVKVSCQEDNISKVIEKYGEFIEKMNKELDKDIFEKQKRRFINSINFGHIDLSSLCSWALHVYYEEEKMYGDTFNKEYKDKMRDVTYEEANDLYKKLFTCLPHVTIISKDEKYKELNISDLKTTK